MQLLCQLWTIHEQIMDLKKKWRDEREEAKAAASEAAGDKDIEDEMVEDIEDDFQRIHRLRQQHRTPSLIAEEENLDTSQNATHKHKKAKAS